MRLRRNSSGFAQLFHLYYSCITFTTQFQWSHSTSPVLLIRTVTDSTRLKGRKHGSHLSAEDCHLHCKKTCGLGCMDPCGHLWKTVGHKSLYHSCFLSYVYSRPKQTNKQTERQEVVKATLGGSRGTSRSGEGDKRG
jgi:hypothetical protein